MKETLQVVTFQMSKYNYGIDIMNVDSIIDTQSYRDIPNSPPYLKGILNVRGEIIPLISLQDRFFLPKIEFNEADRLLSGYMVINIDDFKVAIVIDKISKVLNIEVDSIQKAPEIISEIGHEYIQGIFLDPKNDNENLVILNIKKIFNIKELEKLTMTGDEANDYNI